MPAAVRTVPRGDIHDHPHHRNHNPHRRNDHRGLVDTEQNRADVKAALEIVQRYTR
ncbi:hypothetical protein PBI_SQUIRTY_69 [Mycobacterium phage Squirty]|uniref:Uncharacterized protein n=1 Tax=Mycobacterium phage Squirty TaxID=1527512 RepID=A0A088FBL5_9CAUD|nr:hypothetical protein PBI_SQUIRTY_69 [Mycobacterium phage Squirty]AIM41016.1 hypothetical protein PBI_SQUIRTY_69 [Mycobacterium phage Squirty]